METAELRTAADVIRGLLDFALEHEWVGKMESCPRSCCYKWRTRCPSCDAEAGEHSNPDYKIHKGGCSLHITIQDAEAFLRTEEAANA